MLKDWAPYPEPLLSPLFTFTLNFLEITLLKIYSSQSLHKRKLTLRKLSEDAVEIHILNIERQE